MLSQNKNKNKLEGRGGRGQTAHRGEHPPLPQTTEAKRRKRPAPRPSQLPQGRGAQTASSAVPCPRPPAFLYPGQPLTHTPCASALPAHRSPCPVRSQRDTAPGWEGGRRTERQEREGKAVIRSDPIRSHPICPCRLCPPPARTCRAPHSPQRLPTAPNGPAHLVLVLAPRPLAARRRPLAGGRGRGSPLPPARSAPFPPRPRGALRATRPGGEPAPASF